MDDSEAKAVLDTIGSEEMHWLTLCFTKPGESLDP